MKNYRWLFCCLFLVALFGCTHRSAVVKPAPSQPPVAAPATKPEREERSVIIYEGVDGETALALLKARAQVKTESSALGELVVEINGVRSGNGYNFLYFVNGAMPKTGAGNYLTKAGEKIEWKLVGPRPASSAK